MRENIIFRTELINLLINESFENFKKYIDDNIIFIRKIKEDEILFYYIFNKIILSSLLDGSNGEKIGRALEYVFGLLNINNKDCLTYGRLKSEIAILKSQKDYKIKLLIDKYREILSLDINDILLEQDLYDAAVLLSSNYAQVSNNLKEIMSYTNRLKKIESLE